VDSIFLAGSSTQGVGELIEDIKSLHGSSGGASHIFDGQPQEEAVACRNRFRACWCMKQGESSKVDIVVSLPAMLACSYGILDFHSVVHLQSLCSPNPGCILAGVHDWRVEAFSHALAFPSE
jgi:hypothetical protein